MSEETLAVYTLSEARVLATERLPGECILAIRSGRDVTHYALPVADLAALAERLRQDALLLAQGGAATS